MYLGSLFLGPPSLPPPFPRLRNLPPQRSQLPPPPAPPAQRSPPHPQQHPRPRPPQKPKSPQVCEGPQLTGSGARREGVRARPLLIRLSTAPETVGATEGATAAATEEQLEDGEPDAAELRRRRLQKLESPVAH